MTEHAIDRCERRRPLPYWAIALLLMVGNLILILWHHDLERALFTSYSQAEAILAVWFIREKLR